MSILNTIQNATIKLYPKYRILPSLTMAQAIVESGHFKSKLSKYNNFFGMKYVTGCGSGFVTLPTKEWDGQSFITIRAKFRSYSTVESGIEGYYKFLSYKRYKNLVGVTDYKKACELIQKDGWATSPVYAKTLISVIESYKLHEIDNKVLGKKEKKESTAKTESAKEYYTVKSGDTLLKIAHKYHTTVKKLVAWNGIKNPDLIKVGERFRVK